MSDQADWLKQLAQSQEQYWSGWREMAGQALGQAPRPANAPWQDGLEAWSRMVNAPGAGVLGAGFGAAGMPGMPGAAAFAAPGFGAGGFGAGMPGMAGFDQNQVFERLMANGKQYLELLQGMMSGRGFQSGAGFDPNAWIEELRGLHQRHGHGLLGGVAPMPWFGGIDAGQVEQMVKAFSGNAMRGVQQELGGWLNLPAFGLSREHAERGQALMRAWVDHQAATTRYRELMLQSAGATLDKLQGLLAEREQPGRQLDSAKALYDLWIDAAEDAFNSLALSPEYRQVSGDLVNTQMRVRAGLNAEIERLGAQFGLPTRTEVDSMARQIHELKRELRRLGGRPKQASAAATRSDPAGARRPAAQRRAPAKPPAPARAPARGAGRGATAGAPAKHGPARAAKPAKRARKTSARATAKKTARAAPAPAVARPAQPPRARTPGATAADGAKTRAGGADMPVIKSTAGASGKGR
jgi:class III poly(R)-hydroxyalkanoic acid synthase PhaE subunit